MKRFTIGTLLVALACLAAAFGAGFAIYLRPAQATRNSSGTYSIPNTFTAGTTISSSSVNSNFSDLSTEMTASLERNGKGGMLAALRGVDGTLAAPAFSWTSETGSGLFRNGAGDVRMAVSGAASQQWTASAVLPILPLRAANGAVATPSLSFANDTADGLYRSGSHDLRFAVNGTDVSKWTAGVFSVSPSASGSTANGNSVATFEKSGANGISLLAPNANSVSLWFGDVASNVRGGIDYFMSAHASADQMKFNTNNTVRMTISNTGTLFASGIGADGSGFKHKRVGGCTTAASQGATCDTTVTWGTTFADANYTAVCVGDLIGGGTPFGVGLSSKSASAIAFQTKASTAIASSFTTVDCVAVHD